MAKKGRNKNPQPNKQENTVNPVKVEENQSN
jgi:hypothetical protein